MGQYTGKMTASRRLLGGGDKPKGPYNPNKGIYPDEKPMEKLMMKKHMAKITSRKIFKKMSSSERKPKPNMANKSNKVSLARKEPYSTFDVKEGKKSQKRTENDIGFTELQRRSRLNK